MTITKTEELTQITILGLTNSEGNSTIRLNYRIKIDDPDDDQLPVFSGRERDIRRYTTDENGFKTQTDISNEDQLIQDIAALFWTD